MTLRVIAVQILHRAVFMYVKCQTMHEISSFIDLFEVILKEENLFY